MILRIVTICLFVLFSHTANAEKRVALVIGNGAYINASPLANPANDARAIAAKLRELGFETVEGYDLDRRGVDDALREFARTSRDADVNIFFYAGHGMSVGGTNYLVPVDAAFEDEIALDFEAVPIEDVTRQMSRSDAVNLVFLDACRDNPLSRSLSRSMGSSTRSARPEMGLAEVKIDNPGRGLAIAFATSPGEVALDGEGNHSPFTNALLNHIGAENTDITEVFSRVTGDVYRSTNEQQRPWLNTSLTGPVMLNPQAVRVAPAPSSGETAAATAAAAQPAEGRMARLEEQKLLFNLARETEDAADYQAYLDTFPNGLYANNAKRMIAKLRGTRTAALGSQQSTVIGNNNDRTATPTQPTRSINEYGALQLEVTQAVRNQVGSEYTEAALDLDRQKRGELQSRLNAAGASVGRADGLWGKGTRRGISTWQAMNGLHPTGYMNSVQVELLVSQTEGRYEPYVASKRVVTTRRTPVQRTQTRTSPQSSTNNDLPEAGAVGRFLGGVLKQIVD